MSKWRLAALVLCVATIAGLLIYRPWSRYRRSPNVILLCVDAMRGDHVQAAGYERDTTPNLDRLIKRSVYFRHAYSQYTATQLSVGSLFTSRYPDHFVRMSDRQALGRIHNSYAMVPEDFPVMPEYFHKLGYHTASVTANSLLTAELGYGRGFDELHVLPPDPFDLDQEGLPHYARAGKVNELVLRRCQALLRSRQPFFLYVHYMDPHEAYLPPEGVRGRYAKDLRKSERLDWQNTPARRDYGFYQTLTEEDVGYMMARYDEEIRYFDHEFGRLLDALENNGALDNTLLIVFADHGEQFLEHGYWGHVGMCTIEEVHVPLLFHGPGLKPNQVDRPVGLIDVFPTLVDLIAEDPEALRFAEGTSLAGLLRGRRPADTADAAVLSAGLGTLSVRTARESYVLYHSPQELYGDARRRFGELDPPEVFHHYYRLDSDPHEERDLFATHRQAAARLDLMLRTTFDLAVSKDYWLGDDLLASWVKGDTAQLKSVLTLAPPPDGVSASLAAGSEGGHRLEIANRSSAPQAVKLTVATKPNTVYLFGVVYAVDTPTSVRFAIRDGDTPLFYSIEASEAGSPRQWTGATPISTAAPQCR